MRVQAFSFQPITAFHMETSYLICPVNQMTGSYMSCNIRLKRGKLTQKRLSYGCFVCNFAKFYFTDYL